MGKAYAELGVHNLADLSEIEKAYRYKKGQYDLSSFEKGSMAWQFALVRNKALDEAYRYAKAEALNLHPVLRPQPMLRAQSPSGEIWGLALICPIAIYILQVIEPSVFHGLAPRRLHWAVWFFGVILLSLGYLFPLLVRFVFLKRPVRSFSGMLLLFIFSMLFSDITATVLLRLSVLPGNGAIYIPAFYLLGAGPLFILLHVHCTILGLPFRGKTRKRIPAVPRLAAYTFTLVLSVALSTALSAALN